MQSSYSVKPSVLEPEAIVIEIAADGVAAFGICRCAATEINSRRTINIQYNCVLFGKVLNFQLLLQHMFRFANLISIFFFSYPCFPFSPTSTDQLC